jgi:hypothetical protein
LCRALRGAALRQNQLTLNASGTIRFGLSASLLLHDSGVRWGGQLEWLGK